MMARSPKPPLMSRRNDAKTDTIAAGAFKARCLELMDRVREKKVEYVITKHGRPVAKLVPCDEGELPDARGAMAGLVVRYGDIVSPDFEAWEESD